MLDHISNGRMEFGIGMGYVPKEFEAFGVPLKNRVSMTDEAIEILRLAWKDEPFSFKGKRYELSNINVYPKPVQPLGPPLWIAAMKEPGALRAARFETNLLPQGRREDVLDPWRNELKAQGKDPNDYRVGIIRSVCVTDDKERDWPVIREAERFRMGVYNTFMAETPDEYGWGSGDGIPQNVIIGTPSEVISQLKAFIDAYGITDIATSGLPPGIDPEFMAANLERLAREVIPELSR